MSYARGYANSHLCASAHGRRAAGAHRGPARPRRVDALVWRRCQILLARARGERAPRIAAHLGCDDQTVRDALHACTARGVRRLTKGSSRPHHPPPHAFPGERAEQVRALVQRRPRDFGHPSSLWTLDLAAEGSFAQGLTPRLVTGEAIRQTVLRLGMGWKRAKHGITSPDPADARKTGAATACATACATA